MSLAEHSGAEEAPVPSWDAARRTRENFTASRSRVDSGTSFDPHHHQEDQLAWMHSGSMELRVLGERSHLRREHFAWIPAGLMHEMLFDEPGELISVYADPALRPSGEGWAMPRMLHADELAGALMLHLVAATPGSHRRIRVRELLADLLGESPVQLGAVVLPRDPRARAVASALLDNPADARGLGDWAKRLGVSAKTIARAFEADTGSTFREWRILSRLHAAAGMLARGESVQTVAGRVGYESASSFIAAFKTRYGDTPARYSAALALSSNLSPSATLP